MQGLVYLPINAFKLFTDPETWNIFFGAIMGLPWYSWVFFIVCFLGDYIYRKKGWGLGE